MKSKVLWWVFGSPGHVNLAGAPLKTSTPRNLNGRHAEIFKCQWYAMSLSITWQVGSFWGDVTDLHKGPSAFSKTVCKSMGEIKCWYGTEATLDDNRINYKLAVNPFLILSNNLELQRIDGYAGLHRNDSLPLAVHIRQWKFLFGKGTNSLCFRKVGYFFQCNHNSDWRPMIILARREVSTGNKGERKWRKKRVQVTWRRREREWHDRATICILYISK